eukprot:11362096-Prorocentrum_lima.AAC.1
MEGLVSDVGGGFDQVDPLDLCVHAPPAVEVGPLPPLPLVCSSLFECATFVYSLGQGLAKMAQILLLRLSLLIDSCGWQHLQDQGSVPLHGCGWQDLQDGDCAQLQVCAPLDKEAAGQDCLSVVPVHPCLQVGKADVIADEAFGARDLLQ